MDLSRELLESFRRAFELIHQRLKIFPLEDLKVRDSSLEFSEINNILSEIGQEISGIYNQYANRYQPAYEIYCSQNFA